MTPASLKEAVAPFGPAIVRPGLYRLGQCPGIYCRWEDHRLVLVTDLGETPRTWATNALARHGLVERDGAVVALVPLGEVAAAVQRMAAFREEVGHGTVDR